MAQQSILMFFSVKNNKKEETTKLEEKLGSDGDSPVKQSRKKRQRISSSSSEEQAENKTQKKTKLIAKLSKFEAHCNGKDEVNEAKPPDDKINKASESSTPNLKKKVKNNEAEVKSKCDDSPKSSKSPRNDDKNTSPIKESQCSTKKELNTPSNIKLTSSPEKKVEQQQCRSIEDYNPGVAANKYHLINDACWKKNEKVPYLALSRTLEEIEKTSARLKMIEILSNYLRSVLVLSPDDFLPSVYMCLNKIGPAYEGLELGLAEQTLIRAISQSTGRTFSQIKNDVQESGDLGAVAERSRSSQRLMFRPQPLTVRGIFLKFREIAAMSGLSAVNKKISIIQGLFVACRGPEARFLIRSLNGKLRIGLAEQSVLQAVAVACATTPPGQAYPPEILNAGATMSADNFKARVDQLALILKTTFCECPNYDLIVPVLLREGIEALPQHCKITPGIPVKPMLAQPTKGVQEVITRFDGLQFTCEWKYDGERAQIHRLEGGNVKIYSRNQEDNTSKYPDIINRINSALCEDTDTFILDCEAVAWDSSERRILPFQVLSTRKRKDANEADIKVQVCVFMFDLLYLNGQPLVRETLAQRRALLQKHFKAVDGQWQFATSIDTNKLEEMQEFLEDSIKGHCEGLMVKTLEEEATYEIAKRSRNWLKLKKDYLEGVGDTLDLVVMGGYIGKGKRTGSYGGFLIGCYDEDSEEYQTICKIGTGFTDESLQTHTQLLKQHVVPRAPSYYQHEPSLEPDHWFAPVQVWEVRCADLSLSPVHRAALGMIDLDKGISLRFPRFLRVREDKKPEEATTARQVADMYRSQDQVQANTKANTFNEEDFY